MDLEQKKVIAPRHLPVALAKEWSLSKDGKKKSKGIW